MIDFKRKYSVHFIGIGGISMQGLAEFCLSLGWKVTGSDVRKNSYTKKLVGLGATIFTGHRKANILAPNFVIKTSAIKDDNEELEYAKRLGIKVYDRADFLSEITMQYKTVIAVSGAHGKSTTSAMIYEILRESGKKVSCHIGAEVENSRFDLSDEILVLEACEFNKTFLKFKVDVGVVLNVDKEHLDSYGSFYNLKLAFKTFLNHSKIRYVFDIDKNKYLMTGGVNIVEKPIFKFNIGENNSNVKENIEKQNLFIFNEKEYLLNNLLGEQYIFDACVAIKVCSDLGVDYSIIYKVLKDFKPLARRNQLLKSVAGHNIYIDYAHHPTEIKYLIKSFGLDSLYVFQPHTYSRTKYLEKEFIETFKEANVIIYKEYSAREKKTEGLSALDLYKEIKSVNGKAKYIESEEQLKSKIDFALYPNIVFVGAGDINEVAKSYALSL